MLASGDGARLRHASHLNTYVAGAESNVAYSLAYLGHKVEWFGRVGRDPFGARIRDFLNESGIENARVIEDSSRSTGIYFKDHVRDSSTNIHYYRTGSAASVMSPDDLHHLALGQRKLCHVSGVMAALSTTSYELVQAILSEAKRVNTTISFDVNHRAAMWERGDAAGDLLAIARASDIVFVGRDEAAGLWSTTSVKSVRELLPDVPHIVVKDAEIGATHFGPDGAVFIPSLPLEVVEPVGAGDAFAAGFLSGWLDEWNPADALRLGHVLAGFTLQGTSDIPQLPRREEILAVSRSTQAEWRELKLTVPAMVEPVDLGGGHRHAAQF